MKYNCVKSLLVLCVTTFFVGKASEAQVVRHSGNILVGPVITVEQNRGQVIVPFSAGGRTFTLFVNRLLIYGGVGYFPNSACQGPPFVVGLGFDVTEAILPDVAVVGNRVYVQTGDATTITVLSTMFRGICNPTSDTPSLFATEDVGLDLGQFTPPYQFLLQ